MFEIIVISGKGGTGKTSLTGAFAHLAVDPIICDLDVDAPDLHLLLRPRTEMEEDFHSGHLAVIDRDRCNGCGLCAEVCRFQAARPNGDGFGIDPIKCEGCKVCVHFCPAEAIRFESKHCGWWRRSATRFGPLVHAQLFPGEENSGRLVALLRQKAKELAKGLGRELILSDGAPGIGCPVISSLSGVDLAVVVTEPTPSGRHDLERVIDLCGHFRVPAGVVINKYDLSEDNTRAIENHCREKGLTVLARLPHDPAITRAMIAGQVITEYQTDGLAEEIRRAWRNVETLARLAKTA